MDSHIVADWLVHMPLSRIGFTGGCEVEREAARKLNEQVWEYIVGCAQVGWVPSWEIYHPPTYLTVHFDGYRLLRNSEASWPRNKGHEFPVVELGVHRRTPSSPAVRWALAHELCHCYAYPTPKNVRKAVNVVHSSRPWEQFADAVASAVVLGYNREKFESNRRG